MLVLTRRTNEKLVIGSGPDAIELMVVAVGGGKVRLGITAPTSVPIARAELLPYGHPKHPVDGGEA